MAANPRVAWPIYNQLAPAAPDVGGGPRSIFQNLDFTGVRQINIDLTLEDLVTQMQFVQTLYIDNKIGAGDLNIYLPTTQQSLTIRDKFQGYIPVMCNTPIFQFTSIGAATVGVHFINVPMPAILWQAAP